MANEKTEQGETLSKGDRAFIKRALDAFKQVNSRNETKMRAAGDDALADAFKQNADNCEMIKRKM